MLPIMFLGDAKADLFAYLAEAVGFLTLLGGVALGGRTIFAGIQ